MSIDYIDEHATQAAISACHSFSGFITELIGSYRQINASIAISWQGISYNAFATTLERIICALEGARREAETAAVQLSGGLNQALEAEHAARRAEEQRRDEARRHKEQQAQVLL